MSQRVVVLTDELTEPIYDILEECCGAQADGRGEFVAYMRHERNGEWRFGGKLYSNPQGVYVDCYAEHKSPLAKFAIKTANERISALLEHPEGITDEMVERGCNYSVLNREDVTREELVRGILGAALFPGDGEPS